MSDNTARITQVIVIAIILLSHATSCAPVSQPNQTPQERSVALDATKRAVEAFPSPLSSKQATLTPSPVVSSYEEWARQQIDWLLWTTGSTIWMFSDLKTQSDLDRKRAVELFDTFLISRIGVANQIKGQLNSAKWKAGDDTVELQSDLISTTEFLSATLDQLSLAYDNNDLDGLLADIEKVRIIQDHLRLMRMQVDY